MWKKSFRETDLLNIWITYNFAISGFFFNQYMKFSDWSYYVETNVIQWEEENGISMKKMRT